jgi:signal transduction histidine kinase
VCEDERWARFSVNDTGIGIPADVLPGLFQDFAQVDSPLQRRVRGTGLGLSLCRRFAELLGGSVGVTSEVGKGSEFWVMLPIRLESESDLEVADAG